MQVNKIDNQIFQSHQITSKEMRILQTALKNNKVFLYDVDTTHGFMDQLILKRNDGITDGFPVIGADKIIPALLKIKEIFLNKLPKLETVDAHKFSDPEIKFFKFVSDIHSEKGTLGAEKIPETVFETPKYLIEVEPEKDDVPTVFEIQNAIANKEIIRVEKNEIDVLKYGNGNTGKVEENKKGIQLFENLKRAGAEIALVYGVAEEYCVKAAVAACKRFGIIPIVIEDAVKDAGEQALKNSNDLVYNDVATITTNIIEKQLAT
jgi:nicotinamidase-related amidase